MLSLHFINSSPTRSFKCHHQNLFHLTSCKLKVKLNAYLAKVYQTNFEKAYIFLIEIYCHINILLILYLVYSGRAPQRCRFDTILIISYFYANLSQLMTHKCTKWTIFITYRWKSRPWKNQGLPKSNLTTLNYCPWREHFSKVNFWKIVLKAPIQNTKNYCADFHPYSLWYLVLVTIMYGDEHPQPPNISFPTVLVVERSRGWGLLWIYLGLRN